MENRFANTDDLDRLAEWNHQLIQDEGHRNAMTTPQLRDRMKGWLGGEYKAVIFGPKRDPFAYALYKEMATEVYLRQFFVTRGRRSEGIGREAMVVLRRQYWPERKRLTVEVLTSNVRALAFWRSIGFKDYSITLETMPDKIGEQRAGEVRLTRGG